MTIKPLTTRSVVIFTISSTLGSAAGVVADAIGAELGYAGPGAGQVTTALVALWVMDTLNRLIQDDPARPPRRP